MAGGGQKMPKLNQIVAVVNGVKSKVHEAISQLHHKSTKEVLFNGFSRVYKPLNEEDPETQPAERKNVQVKYSEVLEEGEKLFSDLWNVVYTQDLANCNASGDIKVDGKTLAYKVPVTHLLFLEKQLNDLHTFVKKLPELDSAISWHWDDKNNCYRSDEAITHKAKKVMRGFTKAPATAEHPAQVDTYTEDVRVGEWTKTDFSGAIPLSKKVDILRKIEQLQTGVKFAREEANNVDVTVEQISNKLFDFVFRGKI